MAGKSLNKVMLIGHAGKDAEVRYTGSGTAVASFTLATNTMTKDKTSGQLVEKTEWHNITAWERLAEICGEYVKKGKQVYVEGRLTTEEWNDKDGNKRTTPKIIANEMVLLGGGGPGGGGGERQSSYRPAAGPATAAAPVSEYEQAPSDDLPF
jgi:single-strand DNA-binding protein